MTFHGLTGTVGTAVSVQISATDSGGSTLTFSATGLPPGLSIDSSSGLITGTPTTDGLWQPSVTAESATAIPMGWEFGWLIGPMGSSGGGPPSVSLSMPDQTGTAGESLELQILASASDGGDLTYSASGLPPALSLNVTTGMISGTPSTPGIYTVSVTANEGSGPSASATFSWTINTVITMTVPGLSTL